VAILTATGGTIKEIEKNPFIPEDVL